LNHRGKEDTEFKILTFIHIQFILKEDLITENIIGCAIEVHKTLGPGLLESAYEECLHYELIESGLTVVRQAPVPLFYKEMEMSYGFRADLIVEDQVIVEVKAVDKMVNIHKAQLMTYLKLAEMRVGLLINFNVPLLKDGIIRWIV